MSAVGVEGVDPGAEVGVLGAVHNAEDSALAVRGTRQEGNMGRILARGEASSIVGVAGFVVDDWCEPGIEGRVEVGCLESIEVDLAQAVDLTITASGASYFGGNSVEGFVDGCIGRARDGIGTHLHGTFEPGIGVVPEVVVDLHRA